MYSRASTDAGATLARLTAEERAHPAVAHALAVRAAVAASDYHRVFNLYRSAPNASALVMDLFAHALRIGAAQRMAEACVGCRMGAVVAVQT